MAMLFILIWNPYQGDEYGWSFSISQKPMPIQSRQNWTLGCFAEQLLKSYKLKVHALRHRLTVVPGEWGGCHRKGRREGLRSEFQAGHRRSILPNHWIYQSGFPNKFSDWMRWITRERAYPAVQFFRDFRALVTQFFEPLVETQPGFCDHLFKTTDFCLQLFFFFLGPLFLLELD